MGELIEKIEELIKVLENNSVPIWLSWVGVLLPIAISFAVIAQASLQAWSNKKFQKYLSDRDVTVQMHGNFFKIYDAFCTAQNVINKAKNNTSYIFANHNLAPTWATELLEANNNVCQSLNRACLLLPTKDEELLSVLKKIFDEYSELTKKVFAYMENGIIEAHRQQAWTKICQTHGVPYGDYGVLSNNQPAFRDFLKLFSNDNTEEINDIINKILPLFEYEKFDKYFEKYVRIELSEEKKND